MLHSPREPVFQPQYKFVFVRANLRKHDSDFTNCLRPSPNFGPDFPIFSKIGFAMTVRLIFGNGYLGSRVARRWRENGDEVHVVTRRVATAEAWRDAGFAAHVANVIHPESLAGLPAADTLLFAVGHDRSAGPSIDEVYVAGLQNTLDALAGRVGRWIYISSTGVYGPAGGDWIDEETPCGPERPGGIACWQAEQRLVASVSANQAIRLRLAGIYGPQRVPFLELLQAGESLPTPPDSWLNLIHVDDAAEICRWAADAAKPESLYVVSDGQPVLRRDFYAEAARLTGSPPPQFGPVDPSSPRAARASGGNKRVNPARLFRDRNVSLQYPDYRAGLAASLDASAIPPNEPV